METLSVIMAAVGLLLAFIAIIPIKKYFHDNRIERFSDILDELSDAVRYYEACNNILEARDKTHISLLCEKEWNHKKGENYLSAKEIV